LQKSNTKYKWVRVGHGYKVSKQSYKKIIQIYGSDVLGSPTPLMLEIPV